MDDAWLDVMDHPWTQTVDVKVHLEPSSAFPLGLTFSQQFTYLCHPFIAALHRAMLDQIQSISTHTYLTSSSIAVHDHPLHSLTDLNAQIAFYQTYNNLPQSLNLPFAQEQCQSFDNPPPPMHQTL